MISVVMPIRGDEAFLPYSLGSLLNAPIDELVIFLDRCQSQLVKEFYELEHPFKVRVIDIPGRSFAFNPLAEAFELAFHFSRGDYIYTMAADMITDKAIYDKAYFDNHDIVSFQYKQTSFKKTYNLHETYANFLVQLPFIYRCKLGKWSGHMAFKREVWEKLHFHDVTSPDLDFMNRAYDAGFKHLYVKGSRCWHLRPGLSREKQEGQGIHRALNEYSTLKVLLHSIGELKPHVFSSYFRVKARLKAVNDTTKANAASPKAQVT